MDNRKPHITTTRSLSKKFKRESEADDLPDITLDLMSRLRGKWAIDDNLDEHPLRLFVNTLREHMDAINPYIEAVQIAQAAWYNCWSLVYKIAQELDQATEESVLSHYYSIPEELRTLELTARADLSKADGEWEAAKIEYSTEIDKRNQEILEIQNNIKLITETKDIDVLNKYDKHPVTTNTKSTRAGGVGGFLSIFGYHAPKIPATKSVTDEEKRLNDLRECLLIEYNDNLVFKTNRLKEYAERAPEKPLQYRHAWNAVRARILHNQIEFYRCQTKEVMLHGVRLYVMAFRSFYVIYGESPFNDEKKQTHETKLLIAKIRDESDLTVAKAKELFKQMIAAMKNQLANYYCLQPNRCEFTQYLDNFNRIPTVEVRDAILAGNADEEMLEQIFPEFETPFEEFQSTAQSP